MNDNPLLNALNKLQPVAKEFLDKTRADIEQASQQIHATGAKVNELKDLGKQLVSDLGQNIQENVMPIFSHLKIDTQRSSESVKKGVFQSHMGVMEFEFFIPTQPIIRSVEDRENYAAYLRPTALIVMLHGCGQTAEDFAIGTQMNEWAQKYNYHVLYPQQSKTVNPKGCWNWFLKTEQTKNIGQSGMIAALTYKVMAQYELAGGPVFVAGLSAGGSMAHILASNYPELYTAAGIVSGIPMGIAVNAKEALEVMKYGPKSTATLSPAPTWAKNHFTTTPPMIIFHGLKDVLVHAKNADYFIDQALEYYKEQNPLNPHPTGSVRQIMSLEKGHYQTTSYKNKKEQNFLEYWRMDEVGHAWPGGSDKGSFTTTKGVNATEKMIAFFEQFRRLP